MEKLNFLVVESSLTSRKIIVNCLRKIGYMSIIEATDGKDALGKMYTENIGCIITDWIMPSMDGLEFVRAVKKDISFKEIPVLMITTRGRKSDILAALKAGVDNYIIMPFTTEVLKEKIDAILDKRRSKL